MDTQVFFELLDKPDRIEGVASLLLRRGRLKPPVLVLCPDQGFAAKLDDRLWTIHPESFLAHGVDEGNAQANAKQPILLATDIIHDNGPEVLINGGLEVPTDVSGFKHIVDFVDGWDESLKQAARDRFRTYRQMGLNPTYLGKK